MSSLYPTGVVCTFSASPLLRRCQITRTCGSVFDSEYSDSESAFSSYQIITCLYPYLRNHVLCISKYSGGEHMRCVASGAIMIYEHSIYLYISKVFCYKTKRTKVFSNHCSLVDGFSSNGIFTNTNLLYM